MGIETIAAVAAPVVGSVLGGIGGSQGSGGGTQTQTASSAPWEPQQPYLTYGFGESKTALENALKNPVYQGPRVAALNPFQTSGANWLANFTQNNGFNSANNLFNASSNLVNAGGNYGTNAQNIFNQFSGVDPTAQIIANAGQYANNPYVDGIIDASARDVTRNLYESQLPGINRAASGTGNTNSTRAGVESAILQRGAADRLADMSNDIRGKFFNQGLTMSQNQFNRNLENMLAANTGLLQGFNTGITGTNAAQNVAAGNFDALNAAGGLFQGFDQANINADMAKFNETNNNPLDLIAKYMATVNGNYGGTSNSTTTLPTQGGGLGGALAGGLGGAIGGTGIFGTLKKAGIFG